LLRHQATPGARRRSAVAVMAQSERRAKNRMGRPRAHRMSITRHSALTTGRPRARWMSVVFGPWTDAGVGDEQLMARFPSCPCALVDKCWKKAPRTAISCHFLGTTGVASRYQSSIGKSFHARQIRPDTWCSWAIKIPRGMRRPRTVTSISAPCSLSQAEIAPRLCLPRAGMTVI
jgi:hypothetical protein